jgi:murein DD-endopeptidase MepM/ murein hydrolase activator NlpD
MFAFGSRRGLQSGLRAYVNLRMLLFSMAVENPSTVPDELCSSFGSYPNPLKITDADRASFHPVVKFPTIQAENASGEPIQVPDLRVVDLTKPTNLVYIVTEDQRAQRRKEAESGAVPTSKPGVPDYNVGRYDEDRRGLYISEMFEKDLEAAGKMRTVHIGIDLGCPIGTEVHAFTDGIVHSVGYNSELGDYGNVIVIEHTIPSNGQSVWALYGHLDGSTLQRGNHPGKEIKKGEVVGLVGDIFENGGW